MGHEGQGGGYHIPVLGRNLDCFGGCGASPPHCAPRKWVVPEVGIEPTRGCPRRILNPVRLPISPLRHARSIKLPSREYTIPPIRLAKFSVHYLLFSSSSPSHSFPLKRDGENYLYSLILAKKSTINRARDINRAY